MPCPALYQKPLLLASVYLNAWDISHFKCDILRASGNTPTHHFPRKDSNIQVTYNGTVAEGEEVVLFKNVRNSGSNGTEFELTLNGKTTTATLSDGNVVVDYVAAVPEPTTATLILFRTETYLSRPFGR